MSYRETQRAEVITFEVSNELDIEIPNSLGEMLAPREVRLEIFNGSLEAAWVDGPPILRSGKLGKRHTSCLIRRAKHSPPWLSKLIVELNLTWPKADEGA